MTCQDNFCLRQSCISLFNPWVNTLLSKSYINNHILLLLRAMQCLTCNMTCYVQSSSYWSSSAYSYKTPFPLVLDILKAYVVHTICTCTCCESSNYCCVLSALKFYLILLQIKCTSVVYGLTLFNMLHKKTLAIRMSRTKMQHHSDVLIEKW